MKGRWYKHVFCQKAEIFHRVEKKGEHDKWSDLQFTVWAQCSLLYHTVFPQKHTVMSETRWINSFTLVAEVSSTANLELVKETEWSRKHKGVGPKERHTDIHPPPRKQHKPYTISCCVPPPILIPVPCSIAIRYCVSTATVAVRRWSGERQRALTRMASESIWTGGFTCSATHRHMKR